MIDSSFLTDVRGLAVDQVSPLAMRSPKPPNADSPQGFSFVGGALVKWPVGGEECFQLS